MGRTHLQDAVPIRLGQEFEAYGAVLKRDIERIQDAEKYLYEVSMGGTAVGTGLNAEPMYIQHVIKYLRENSGLDVRSEEHTSELQSRGHLVCRLLLEKKKLSSK